MKSTMAASFARAVKARAGDLRLEGKAAKGMHGLKPGSKVKLTIHGRMMNVGIDEYDGKSRATVSVNRVAGE